MDDRGMTPHMHRQLNDSQLSTEKDTFKESPFSSISTSYWWLRSVISASLVSLPFLISIPWDMILCRSTVSLQLLPSWPSCCTTCWQTSGSWSRIQALYESPRILSGIPEESISTTSDLPFLLICIHKCSVTLSKGILMWGEISQQSEYRSKYGIQQCSIKPDTTEICRNVQWDHCSTKVILFFKILYNVFIAFMN